MNDDRDYLGAFFSRFFHQAWAFEFSTPSLAVEAFISAVSPEDLRKTLLALRALKRDTPPSELPIELWKLGSYLCSIEPGYGDRMFSRDKDPQKAKREHVKGASKWLDEVCTLFEKAIPPR